MKIVLVFAALTGFVLVAGEPPVPSNQYLPSNQYGAPSPTYSAPSGSYGAPNQNYGVPSQNYGAPSQNYGAPSQNYGAPSRNYGAPSQTTAVIRPNANYGTPSRPTNNYLPPSTGGYSSGGGYGGYDDQSEPANYNFKYDVQDSASGNDFGHEEARQGDVARGKYYVLLPDGRRQVVEYTADNEGYKPKISYEQIGGGGYGGAGGYSSGGYSGGGYTKSHSADGYQY